MCVVLVNWEQGSPYLIGYVKDTNVVSMSKQYNPFVELERLFERMSRQFAETAEGWDQDEPFRLPVASESMKVDLADAEDELVATVDVPGFEREDIDVVVANRTLTITAEREEHFEESEPTYLRQEREHHSIHRSLELPEEIDDEQVTATMKHGVLTIRMPKLVMEEGKHVEISID